MSMEELTKVFSIYDHNLYVTTELLGRGVKYLSVKYLKGKTGNHNSERYQAEMTLE